LANFYLEDAFSGIPIGGIPLSHMLAKKIRYTGGALQIVEELCNSFCWLLENLDYSLQKYSPRQNIGVWTFFSISEGSCFLSPGVMLFKEKTEVENLMRL
jgi:hypothetical protein